MAASSCSDQTAHIFVEFVCQSGDRLFSGWVRDGWDGALAMGHGDPVNVQAMVSDAGKNL